VKASGTDPMMDSVPNRLVAGAEPLPDFLAARHPGEVAEVSVPARPRRSLLWRVFVVNASLLVLAAALLLATPITISAPITLAEAAVIVGTLIVMLASNLFLLRWTMSPLRRLAAVMETITPQSPGRRLALTNEGAEAAAFVTAFNAMLDRLETERRESARRALAAQEAERLRVARELHDEVGQTLTAVAIQAERAAQDQGGGAHDVLAELAHAVQGSLDDVRRIARELRPEALDDLGLINALIALCTRISAQSGIRVERRLDASLPSLGTDVELVIYRVAQESLTNVLRHADATDVVVSLGTRDRGVVLTVRDDGRGVSAPLAEGTGIAGMRERAMLIGASLTLRSAPGEGTEVQLVIPVAGET
jgi:two-component system sensor histidine kinase UhpB